ncbi:Ribosomal RNA small subunit methyltransferase H [Candidatus Westeberhardia cardiocondylae]|uniref:Ribosomal RNA small subunit methyltransferase H n=1 Tax=Candidatus Westeberhardia cardiocondylae TaxID=1594731 RepID=A0A0H5C5A4_9ENTR|nr:16S rRNA (cytosine(1402)-N(4))-methyltransferase RsmH [Candidatus Westeberhardia cardiocondylae]CEN32116.1 Ribosomal RNA small subunit methyltransferase H [Candidatus Westeberhardia cardiocondylae]
MQNTKKHYIHIPVLLNEAINSLNIQKNGIYIDGTFGQGGHSRLILSKLNKKGKLLAIDRDLESYKIGLKIYDSRFTIIHELFSNMKNYIYKNNLTNKINGVLLDLGVSSLQLNNPKRGFSFKKNGPLDMRMDTTNSKSAKTWLKKAKMKDIYMVLKNFGEEKFSKKIAKAIFKKKNITYTQELTELILQTIPNNKKYKIHPATRSFQAIRIFINNELSELKKTLENISNVLISQGRLAIISFHSLEKRIIKQFIKKYNKPHIQIPHNIPLKEKEIMQRYKNTKQIKIIDTIKPSKKEIKKNPRARSATLYIIKKI